MEIVFKQIIRVFLYYINFACYLPNREILIIILAGYSIII